MRPRAKGSWIVVCRLNSPEKTSEGGIIISSNHEDHYFEAVVSSAGSDCEDLGLNPGDHVLVRNSLDRIEIGSVKRGSMYAVSYDDVICDVDPVDDDK